MIVRDTLARVVTIVANVLVGGNDDPPALAGMAHAQEHMAFRGCADMSVDQTAAIYAQLGGDNNATTGQEVTRFYATVPSTDIDLTLQAQAKCLEHMDDSESEWAKERPSMDQEVNENLSDPEYRVVTRIRSKMFAGTPYARDGLGTKAAFRHMPASAIGGFCRKWYTPSNEILVIVGDVAPEETLRTVARLFGGIHAAVASSPTQVHLLPFQSEHFALQGTSASSSGYIAFRMPGTDSVDYPATRILAEVLGSRRADVYNLVVDGWASQTDFSLDESYRKASMGLATMEVPRGGSVAQTSAEFRRVLRRYALRGVPHELVDTAKRKELTRALFQSTSIPDLAEAWSNAVADEGRLSPEEDSDAIRKVTQVDVNRVARRYLMHVSTISATLTAGASETPTNSSTTQRTERQMPDSTLGIELPPWAARLGLPRVPSDRQMPSDTTIPNGLRLIVKTDHTSPIVTLVGAIKHNAALQTRRGKEGAAEILDSLYFRGTQSKTPVEFQKALDSLSAQESAGVTFSLRVRKDDFPRGVELLAENELTPALDVETFESARKDASDSAYDAKDSVDYQFQRALNKALLPSDDPELRSATSESLMQVTLADVGEYAEAVMRPDLTTIVVVGDVTQTDAEGLISRYFGAWTAKGPKPVTTLPKVPLNRASITTFNEPSRQQASVVLAEELELTRKDPDYYPLQLGTQVLDGGFYAARLYRDLRRDKGYVYDVDVDLEASMTRTRYSVTFDCSQGHVAQVRAIVERELERMRTENVSAAELYQTKALVVRQIALQGSSLEKVASGLLDRAQNELPLDEPVQAAKVYLTLDADSVRRAFARLVKVNSLVQVGRGPFPIAASVARTRHRWSGSGGW